MCMYGNNALIKRKKTVIMFGLSAQDKRIGIGYVRMIVWSICQHKHNLDNTIEY